MKKIVVSIIFLLLLSVLVFTSVNAQDTPPGMPEEIGKSPEELKEDLKNKTETSKEYLKKEWKKILLEKPVIGPILRFTDAILNPVSKILLKREIEFSWAYLLTVLLWGLILYLAGSTLYLLMRMDWIKSSLAGLIVSSLTIRTIPNSYFELQVSLIWKAILALVLAFFIVALTPINKKLKEYLSKEKKKTREMKAEAAEKLHEKELKAYADSE